MHLHAINGAAQQVRAGETAVGHRDRSFAPACDPDSLFHVNQTIAPAKRR